MLFRYGTLFCIIAVTIAAYEKPRFKYSRTNKVMLIWDEIWEVGSPNCLAFLHTNRRLIIKIVVEGNVSRSLHFKCHPGAEMSGMDLESLKISKPEIYCSDAMPFSITLRSDKQFEFILLESSLSYSHAFTDKIELQVHVEHTSGKIVSNSLFIWNLNVFKKMEKPFLTDAAVSFLQRMEMPENITSIQFLDPDIIRMIKNAPDFLKSKISIGAMVYFDSGFCENYQSSRASLFVNKNSRLNDQNQNLLKHINLDTETGLLHFSRYGLSSAMRKFHAKNTSPQHSICSFLSIAGEHQPYELSFSITNKIDKSEFIYPSLSSKNPSCRIVDSAKKSVTIFSGMDYTPFVCPIICDDPNQEYRFYHGEKRLISVPSSVNGIRVLNMGNVIEFPPTLDNRYSGVYRCETGGLKFQFDTKVISMPLFASPSSSVISGYLPSTIYAMEGEGLLYNCTAYVTDANSTFITPVFYSYSDDKWGKLGKDGEKWGKFNLVDFNSIVAPSSGDKPLSVTPTSQAESLTLTYKIGRVPPAKTAPMINFTHRAVCEVSVATSVAEKIGMPSYSVNSGSNVFFLSRPLLSSFSMAKNCSLQSCTAAQGAYFQFSLKPDLVAYLTSIGVTVTGYFKIDKAYQEFVKVLNAPGVAEISYDNASTKLTFKVNPITKPEVLKELQMRKTLTPVFNFRYKEGSKAPNLVFDKRRYGQPDLVAGVRDCRGDDLCFYSTDFDANSTLQGLMLGLEFKDQPVVNEPTRAGSSIIVGIILAIVLLLIIAVLIVFLLRRDTGQTYLLDEKERQQGNHPEQEAKEEQFKEYQRPEEGPLKASRLSMGSSISAASKDDQELEEYGNDDIDCTKFVEDGSFIGDYSTDARRRDAFNAHQV